MGDIKVSYVKLKSLFKTIVPYLPLIVLHLAIFLVCNNSARYRPQHPFSSFHRIFQRVVGSLQGIPDTVSSSKGADTGTARSGHVSSTNHPYYDVIYPYFPHETTAKIRKNENVSLPRKSGALRANLA
jgi:hypothetical protein